MGMLETFKSREGQENKEGFQKELVGDAVATCKGLESIVAKKSGKTWLILKSEVIHPVPDPKGRETTMATGDEITTFYDPEDNDSSSKLQDDLFTAGFKYSSDVPDLESLIDEIDSVVKDHLIYYRCYMGKKFTREDDGSFTEVTGQKVQRIKIKSGNLITEELKQPVLPF